MAHKTTSTRNKKTAASAISTPVPEVLEREVVEEARTAAQKEPPKNGKTATVAAPVNLEEEIRLRAYELYLQRRATSGSIHGDPNQDWLVAEREVRMRHSSHAQHTA